MPISIVVSMNTSRRCSEFHNLCLVQESYGFERHLSNHGVILSIMWILANVPKFVYCLVDNVKHGKKLKDYSYTYIEITTLKKKCSKFEVVHNTFLSTEYADFAKSVCALFLSATGFRGVIPQYLPMQSLFECYLMHLLRMHNAFIIKRCLIQVN